MNVQSLVQDTVLDNTVALLGPHTTGTQRVPGSLAVSSDPLLNVCNVLNFLLAVSRHIARESTYILRVLQWLVRDLLVGGD